MNNKKYFYCEDKGLWDEATEKNCHLWHEDRLHTHTSVFSAIIELKWENSRLISDYVHEGLIPSYA